jgi:hypothetical protein
MSDTTYCTSIGVVKFSQKKAGYPDVIKIAKDWVNDPDFLQVIIRKVSKDDWGIQFIYYNPKMQKPENNYFFEKYVKPHMDIIYAYDIHTNGGTKEDALSGILKNIVIE